MSLGSSAFHGLEVLGKLLEIPPVIGGFLSLVASVRLASVGFILNLFDQGVLFQRHEMGLCLFTDFYTQ